VERRQFVKMAAAAGAAALLPSSLAAATAKPGRGTAKKGMPKLGVSLYSYSQLLHRSMTLEDCFADIYDMGCTTFEMFGANLDGYPYPSTQTIDRYFSLVDRYKLEPGEYACNVDTHLRRGPRMTDDEIVEYMVREIKLANTLGFRCMRSRMTDKGGGAGEAPEDGWQSYMARLLPYAEKYDVILQPEIKPQIKVQYVDDYLSFIDKHQTKHFGINVDFATFGPYAAPKMADGKAPPIDPMRPAVEYAKPEDIIPILPYIHTCHAKFYQMSEDFQETTITAYPQVLKIMQDHGWNGNLVSEFEGVDMGRDLGDRAYVCDQLRRQHVMMRRVLGYTNRSGGSANG